MGDYIAIGVVLLAMAIIVIRIVRSRKGDRMPDCCAGCTGCELEKYGIFTDKPNCGTDPGVISEMSGERSSSENEQ